ncbi:hypothetical protein [Subtercola lobariae]|uniref:Uncharacterized protein n=1 Tax=Subtercola lobariae TaxID=1588641 RepID=A0A917B300_9MICO|nr:hypothetical protein [Subtercola lobariae]GGF14861.1 hypothetical protein GCM10011399_05940 [Subtercola lobariae]
MKIEPLVKLVNEALAAQGGGPFIQGPFVEADTDRDANESVVTGKMHKRDLSLLFHVNSGKTENAYTVSLRDDATGIHLGSGEGQSTFADAISAYHWNAALTELNELA